MWTRFRYQRRHELLLPARLLKFAAIDILRLLLLPASNVSSLLPIGIVCSQKVYDTIFWHYFTIAICKQILQLHVYIFRKKGSQPLRINHKPTVMLNDTAGQLCRGFDFTSPTSNATGTNLYSGIQMCANAEQIDKQTLSIFGWHFLDIPLVQQQLKALLPNKPTLVKRQVHK